MKIAKSKFVMIMGIFLNCYLFLPAAYLSNAVGNVFYKSDDKWLKVEKGIKVYIKPDTEITTERASSVELYFDNGSKLKIGPFSYYKFINEDEKEISSFLFIGKIRNWVKKLSKEYKVQTPHAVVGVRGTDFLISQDKEKTKIEVYDGSVDVSDFKNKRFMVNKGEYIEINKGGIKPPLPNPDPPQNLNTTLADHIMLAKKEIYSEISKEDVIKKSQAELQMAEYQNKKTAVDAYGYRVRMEEYVIRTRPDQFKYVVLNLRENRFDFGKILFTFNAALPKDLSEVTKTMMTYYGSNPPPIYLTDINSIISNTVDKVTEEATGGRMVPDNPQNPQVYTHIFSNYSFYLAGPDQSSENGGKGRFFWGYSDINNNGIIETNEYSYLGNTKPQIELNYPDGNNFLHSIARNTYSDGSWVSLTDSVIFDNGKVASYSDFKLKEGEDKSSFLDKLNFERVYNSSLFSDKIDLVFSAKLLKDVGLINIR